MLTYGCETWKVTTQNTSYGNAIFEACERSDYKDRVDNEQIRCDLEMQQLLKYTEQE